MPHFHFRREAAQVQHISCRLAIHGTAPFHQIIFPNMLAKMLPHRIPLHSLIHSNENRISHLVTTGPSNQAGNFTSETFCCSDCIECNGCKSLIVVFCYDQRTLKPLKLVQQRCLQRQKERGVEYFAFK